jgi:hypothetical protein
MATTRDRRLIWYFAANVVGTGLLFLFLPRLLRQPYLMPWDYWWVFLLVTPTTAAGALAIGVHAGRLHGWAVGLFYLAAVALELGYGWIGFQLAAVV